MGRQVNLRQVRERKQEATAAAVRNPVREDAKSGSLFCFRKFSNELVLVYYASPSETDLGFFKSCVVRISC